MALSGIVNKFATLITQLIVAMYLLPSEYGIASLAISCRSIAFLFSSGGFHDLLVSRPTSLSRDGRTVLHLVVTLHIVAALILSLLAFPIQRLMETPSLAWAILLVALILPVQAVPSVYISKLKIEERFSTVAAFGILVNLVYCGSAIALAVFGAGTYALLLPMLLSAVLSAILHALASQGLGKEPIQYHRWPSLVNDAKWLLVTAFVVALELTTIPFFLGLRGFNSKDIGIFAFATVLATQAVQLLGANFHAVLLPSLAKEIAGVAGDQHERRIRLLLGYSTWVIVPICGLQVIVAKPLSTYVLNSRWHGLEWVIVTLSVAMAFEPMKLISSAHMLSTRRFGKNAVLRSLSASGAIIAVLICPAETSVEGLALWVSGGWIIGSSVCAIGAMPYKERYGADLIRVIAPPLLCGVVLLLFTHPLATLSSNIIVNAAFWASGFVVLYCVSLCILAPHLVRILLEQGLFFAKRPASLSGVSQPV